jgi:hypothetical protein
MWVLSIKISPYGIDNAYVLEVIVIAPVVSPVAIVKA